jgi:hypothetical protein
MSRVLNQRVQVPYPPLRTLYSVTAVWVPPRSARIGAGMYSNWYSAPLSDDRVNLRGSVFILISPFYFRLLGRAAVLRLELVVLRFAPADTNLKVFLVILTFRNAIFLF